jgi:hypothetical protein
MQIEKREFKGHIEYGYYQGRCFTWHREDGPAIEWANGDKTWWIHGEFHREDGPAIENANGYKSWWIHGKYHREDGPAIEYANGDKEWYLESKEIKEENFEEALKIYKVSKICK